VNEYKINKISDYKWEVEKDEKYGMRVPGIIFSNKELLDHAVREKTIDQVMNVATLPGIIKASFAMPDIHYGYGFPIGGVAAFGEEDGIISPGGVGFDISCGVRILRSNLGIEDVKDKLEDMMGVLSLSIPKGVGTKGKIKLSRNELKQLMVEGINWAIKNGYAWEEDKYFIEEEGRMEDTNPDYVSSYAIDRGLSQIGTLGSGNHFLEIQVVEEIYDTKAAEAMGLKEGQITIMIHSGSRGFGHQVCSDYIKIMQQNTNKYGIKLTDRQLACAPLNSTEGKRYYKAMNCAANYAMVNRQCLAYWAREALEKIFNKSQEKLGLSIVYDVSHNIAKFEEYNIDGKFKKVCVHRKGATRSYPPGHKDIPEQYKSIGQPVLIPGDMGRYSYILVGTEKSMDESFGSTCHGAGRLMSRTKAKKIVQGSELKKELFNDKGIVVVAGSMSGLAEEAPIAYKDVSMVVDIAHNAGLSKKAVRLRPLGVLKG
jgi:tRNA-splicing ligase RtcB (3'-phosphate/5'-hydroxy nucleic acid ligase)